MAMNDRNTKMLAEFTEVPANKDLQQLMLDVSNMRVRYRNYIESIIDRRLYNDIEENFHDIDKCLESVFKDIVSISALHTEYAVTNHFDPKNI